MSDNHTSDRTSTQIENPDGHERLVFTREELERRDFGNYISGLTDGEGCFSLAVRTIGKAKRCEYPVIIFVISMRQDDCNILESMKNYWGNIGSLRTNMKSNSKKRNAKPVARYEIKKISDLKNVVVRHFEIYPLLAKKAIDFNIWKIAVELAYTIHMRPRKWKKTSGSTMLPKISQREVEEFKRLSELLKDQRKYKDDNLLHEYIKPKLNIEMNSELNQNMFNFKL